MHRSLRGWPLWLLMLLLVPRADAAGAADIARRGDPARGVPPCASCHGDAGQGNAAAGFPRLAAQPAGYLRRQLQALAGRRRGNAMKPIAARLDAAEQGALARYYAQLPPPPPPPPPPAPAGAARAATAELAAGRTLADHGDWSRRIPACVRCHGRDGVGVAPDFPALAAQPAGYLRAQLQAWQAHRRPPGPQGLMAAIARRLSAADIRAAAAYFSQLPAQPVDASP